MTGAVGNWQDSARPAQWRTEPRDPAHAGANVENMTMNHQMGDSK